MDSTFLRIEFLKHFATIVKNTEVENSIHRSISGLSTSQIHNIDKTGNLAKVQLNSKPTLTKTQRKLSKRKLQNNLKFKQSNSSLGGFNKEISLPCKIRLTQPKIIKTPKKNKNSLKTFKPKPQKEKSLLESFLTSL